jgi:hypothetical protein
LGPFSAAQAGESAASPGRSRGLSQAFADPDADVRSQLRPWCGIRAPANGGQKVSGELFHGMGARSRHQPVGGWLFGQPYLLLALTSLFWASNIVLGRFIVGHVPPITLALRPLRRCVPDPAAGFLFLNRDIELIAPGSKT